MRYPNTEKLVDFLCELLESKPELFACRKLCVCDPPGWTVSIKNTDIFFDLSSRIVEKAKIFRLDFHSLKRPSLATTITEMEFTRIYTAVQSVFTLTVNSIIEELLEELQKVKPK
jgi:hypothetical protein